MRRILQDADEELACRLSSNGHPRDCALRGMKMGANSCQVLKQDEWCCRLVLHDCHKLQSAQEIGSFAQIASTLDDIADDLLWMQLLGAAFRSIGAESQRQQMPSHLQPSSPETIVHEVASPPASIPAASREAAPEADRQQAPSRPQPSNMGPAVDAPLAETSGRSSRAAAPVGACLADEQPQGFRPWRPSSLSSAFAAHVHLRESGLSHMHSPPSSCEPPSLSASQPPTNAPAGNEHPSMDAPATPAPSISGNPSSSHQFGAQSAGHHEHRHSQRQASSRLIARPGLIELQSWNPDPLLAGNNGQPEQAPLDAMDAAEPTASAQGAADGAVPDARQQNDNAGNQAETLQVSSCKTKKQ